MSLVPNFTIAFKDESFFMKLIGKILFFNPSFMTKYTTTIGHTVYFPTASNLKLQPASSKIVLYHELVHIKDMEKYTLPLFGLLYLLPQLLALLAIPLAFFAAWYVALAWFVLFMLPIPAYFRMKFELKAYTFSVYTLYKMNAVKGYAINFDRQIDSYTSQFTNMSYYLMWPFGSAIKKHLTDALANFKEGKRFIYEDEYYDMVDYLIENDAK